MQPDFLKNIRTGSATDLISEPGYLVAEEPKLLSMEESRSRIRLITEFLETKGDYPLRPDGYYISAT